MRLSGKRFAICYSIAAVIAVIVMIARGVFSASDARTLIVGLCDAFFAAGALMLIAGGLAWTTGEGVADGLTFGVSRFFGRRGTGYETDRREAYAQYKQRKHEKKPHVFEMLICGVSLLIVALVLLIPYSRF